MDLNKAYIYRITHIENIPHIIKNGITHKNSQNRNNKYIAIGDSSLIKTRDSFLMPNNDLLGEYIPFYLGLRTPMLYVIQNGYNGVRAVHASEIIYCVSSVQKVLDAKLDFMYTDGHATDGFTRYYYPKDVNNIINQIDFKATNAKFWKDENDLDLKRRKEAEFLLKQDLEYTNILGFVTFDTDSRSKLLGFGIDKNKVVEKPNFYF